ncbi:uncharacterized protein C1orf141 homolog [Leptodactylus fuscus]
MAQRILLGFDSLDKYSQEILAKRAKKCSLSYLQRIPPLFISLPEDFDLEIDQVPDRRINSGRSPSARASRYPVTSEMGPTVHLRPFTASGHCTSEDCEREKRELKKVTRPRCVSADRRRSWRIEVAAIPDLDTLCHRGRCGPVLSSLGAPFIVSPRDLVQDSSITEKSEIPPYDDTRPEQTPLLPITLGCSGAESTTDPSHPCRESTRKVCAASLCLEDEMRKSDIKIVTVKQKPISDHVQNVSETHPIIYNHPITNLSEFRRNLTTRSYYFSASQKPMGKPFSPTQAGPHPQNKMSHVAGYRQLGLQKSKTNKVSSSDNIKVILHYLSADGATQRVEMAKDGKQKQVSPGNKKNVVDDSKTIHISPTTEKKDEERGVGPVLNGMNPIIAVGHGPPLHGRSHQVSRLFCPNSTRSSSSAAPRPKSVKEMHSWSYISISKPLSPPEGPPEPLQKKKPSAPASPDLVEDTVMPTPRMMFTTKSMILENRNVKSGSQVNPTYLGCERSTDGPQEENKMEGGETVESMSNSGQTCVPPGVELLETTRSENGSNDEQVQKPFPVPERLNTTPVISIPTASIDSVE